VAAVGELALLIGARLGVVVMTTVDEVVVRAVPPVNVRLLLGRPRAGWTTDGARAGRWTVVGTCGCGLVARRSGLTGGLTLAVVDAACAAVVLVCAVPFRTRGRLPSRGPFPMGRRPSAESAP
jgi:hypothetical protein